MIISLLTSDFHQHWPSQIRQWISPLLLDHQMLYHQRSLKSHDAVCFLKFIHPDSGIMIIYFLKLIKRQPKRDFLRNKHLFILPLKPDFSFWLEENIDSVLQNIGVEKDFMSWITFVWELRPRIYNWDLKKIKYSLRNKSSIQLKIGVNHCHMYIRQMCNMQNIQRCKKKTNFQKRMSQLKMD